MEYSLLGPLEVRDGERVIPLGGAKQRALLAALLLHANEVVSRERLIEGLWGVQRPPGADHTLETYVSRLRRALHGSGSEHALVTRARGYMLRIEPDELDLNRFQTLLRDGRRALAEGHAERAAESLGAALALVRGPPLDDIAFFPFAQSEVGRLEEMRLAAQEDRLDAELAAGRSAELVAELDALTKTHPLRERFRAQLMLALYRAGRQADALEAYRVARHYLAEELGVPPGDALRQLEQAILAHAPELEPAVTVSHRGATRPDSVDIPADTFGASAEITAPPRLTALAGEPAEPKTAAQRRSRIPARRGKGLYAVGVLLLAAIAAVGATTAMLRRPRVPPIGTIRTDALGIIDTRRDAIVGEVRLPAAPGSVAVGFGSTWVTGFDSGNVYRIEGRSVRQVIPVSGGPGAIIVGGGAVWIADALDGTVARIDPAVDRVVETIKVGIGPISLAYGDRAVWVADGADDAVVRVDPRTGLVTSRVGLRASPSGLAVGAGAVWVTSESASTVYRIAPDGTEVATIHTGTGPTAVSAGPHAIWVANTIDGTVSRIDPADDVVTATVAVGNGPANLAVASGTVWVTDQFGGSVVRVDGGSSRVTATIASGDEPQGIAVTGGQVWFAVQAPAAAHRGGTLRIAAAIPRLDSIDPGVAFLLFPPQLLGMTNDGLVTLKHVGGSDGTQLVPDLAVSVPAPTDGGRTYRFQLRSGIRYSDGTLVRPEDIRRALERDFRIGSPGASFYTDLAGADRCAKPGRPCDLSAGVAVDNTSNSIAFHLTKPDPEFLYKLTLTFAFAVPAGTPNHDIGTHPIPATGPYRIEQYVPGRRLVLGRNPYFRAWSRPAQPDGYPNRIVWQFGLAASTAVSDIAHGRADWGVYEFPFAPPADQLTQLRTEYAAQTHVNPLPETEYFALHTRVAPFNDVRVRRALNYAIDRNILVTRYGGPDLARPTCQVLPPGVPGYVAYCPYTDDPRRNGTYTGPRLGLARKLVARSHTAGMRVHILTDPQFPPADYLASVLRELGYRASLRIATGARIDRLSSNSRYQIQISRGGWAADYPAPSEFLNRFLSCSSYRPASDANNNDAQFCDTRVERDIRKALPLEATNPAAADRFWTAADHAVTDRAAWLPTVNLNAVDFLSRRVGGYQFHPQWGILLDQLWVTR